jgi:hypothetical protein
MAPIDGVRSIITPLLSGINLRPRCSTASPTEHTTFLVSRQQKNMVFCLVFELLINSQTILIRVETLTHSIDLLEQWLVEVDTDPELRECLVEYARGRGGRTMTEICRGMDNRYQRVAEEQDAIGWRRFMEGMICRGLRGLQELYTTFK